MKGYLAQQAGYDLDVQVHRSGAGYYIGCWSFDLGPISRESEEYWATEPEAQEALMFESWTQRYNP